MSQRVEYEKMTGTRHDQYLSKIQLIVGFLGTPEGTKFKPFRDFLRKNGLWDKEKAPTMLSLVDISWDRKKVVMGPMAKKIANTHSLPDLQDLLYQRLKDANILLIKFVLEALDVKSSGRLHSVHEFYRMLTSYAYPGEYITLPNFQAWLEWLAATGYIKLVGIRWALSDKGERAVAELSQMDVDEILEDMEEDSSEESSEESGPDVPASAPVPSPAAVAAAAPSAASTEYDDDDDDDDDDGGGDEDWADMPPEPEPPDMSALAAADAAFVEQFQATPDEVMSDEPPPLQLREPSVARPGAPLPPPGVPGGFGGGGAPIHAPLPGWGTVVPPSVLATSMDATVIAQRIVAWWNELGDWPVYTAADLGVEVDAEGAAAALEDDALLVELAVIALVIEGRRPQPQIFAFVQRMRDTGFFQTIRSEGGFGQALDALGDLSSEPWTRPLIERLIHVPPLVRQVQSAPGTLARLLTCGSGRAAVELIREKVFSEVWVEAPFWVLRELIRLGVATAPELASCAAVPSRRLLANAARIGLVKAPQVNSFEELIEASESVSMLFGQPAGYGEALEVMDRALGLGA